MNYPYRLFLDTTSPTTNASNIPVVCGHYKPILLDRKKGKKKKRQFSMVGGKRNQIS